jgi:8-oxo-dGTP diphosphatase
MFLYSKKIRIRTAGLIIENGKLLLISHKKNGKEYWLVPGGGVDFGESSHQALVREMKEELSIDVEPGDLLFTADSIEKKGKRHILNLFFSCRRCGGVLSLGKDPRLSGFGFFSADEILSMKIFPPCKNELAAIVTGNKIQTYIGELWEE